MEMIQIVVQFFKQKADVVEGSYRRRDLKTCHEIGHNLCCPHTTAVGQGTVWMGIYKWGPSSIGCVQQLQTFLLWY